MNNSRILALFLMASSLHGAELQLAGIFSDHAVLQRDTALPVWGKAAPGARVSVSFAGQKASTIAESTGSWRVTLDPLAANSEHQSLRVQSGGEGLTVNGIQVGEVWLASGQSNMDMNLQGCARRHSFFKGLVTDPQPGMLRMLKIRTPDTEQPLEDLRTTWVPDTAETRGSFSAAAYFFAKRLAEELKLPIGIIDTAWGGKPIEGFIPRPSFDRHKTLRTILKLADADQLEALKQLEGGVIIRNTAGMPGRIFNGRMAPIAPYALRGFIWYQGESNAGRGEDPRDYRYKQQAMIHGWRKAWNRAKAPFYYVQLPAYKDESWGWIRLREEQRLALALDAHTGMAVTIDLRDTDIHPSNKLDVGHRLARWPLAQVYGRSIAVSGPLFKEASIEGNAIRVYFSHLAGGLITAAKTGLEPAKETPGAVPGGFEIADEAGAWHPAEAVIEAGGETIRVTCAEVNKPVAVRYASEGDPERANLYNAASLPASPFCSALKFLPWQK
ncbi:MAG: sialate O-acetylesterase [Verrucomicrobiota bacterium]